MGYLSIRLSRDTSGVKLWRLPLKKASGISTTILYIFIFIAAAFMFSVINHVSLYEFLQLISLCSFIRNIHGYMIVFFFFFIFSRVKFMLIM